jgi:hypothetical protein
MEPERPKIKKPNLSIGLRAEDEARTRDNQLGRLELYQLSYFRVNADANIKQVSCSANFFSKKSGFERLTIVRILSFYTV